MTTEIAADTDVRVDETRTLCDDFLDTVHGHGSLVALRGRREDGSWDEWTYERYADGVARVAAGSVGGSTSTASTATGRLAAALETTEDAAATNSSVER